MEKRYSKSKLRGVVEKRKKMKIVIQCCCRGNDGEGRDHWVACATTPISFE